MLRAHVTVYRVQLMKTKFYTHKRKGGSYRIRCIAKGSGTLNATGNDELVVYHNQLGQHFVRPVDEFLNTMNEVKQKKPNWPKSAERRALQLMQNGNDGEPYEV